MELAPRHPATGWKLVPLLLPLALVLSAALLPTAKAVITSANLRNSRVGNTYSYTMYNGTVVTGESFVTGTTTYPYVLDSSMNQFIVLLLREYLSFNNKSLDDVGGTLETCMGNAGKDVTGKKCYKALLAANAPADCPAANVLCCPLFWRVGSQNIETTMAQMNVETIFWNGAYAVNDYFANFSESYLMENGNCSNPIFADTTEISLAVDVTGEWRFVPLLTQYVLQETALNVNQEEAGGTYFNRVNPQDLINAAKLKQRPVYHTISSYYIPIIVCAALLFVVWLFVVITCCCGTRRTAARVRRAQLRLLELKSAPRRPGSTAILNDISPESSSHSSSEHSQHRKRQASIRRSSKQSAAEANPGNGSFSSGGSENDNGNREGINSRKATTSSSHKPGGSTKSLKTKEVDFPLPASLPGIRPRKPPSCPDDAPSRAAAAHMARCSSSTGTVVHQVNNPSHSRPSENGWFDV